MNDYISSDEVVIERIEYLKALCRNIVRAEIANLSNKTQQNV